MNNSEEPHKNLGGLLHLYEKAINDQEKLLDDALKGKKNFTQVSDKVYVALIRGDLRRLREAREAIRVELDNLTQNPQSDQTQQESEPPLDPLLDPFKSVSLPGEEKSKAGAEVDKNEEDLSGANQEVTTTQPQSDTLDLGFKEASGDEFSLDSDELIFE